jgi:hypothetical protein
MQARSFITLALALTLGFAQGSAARTTATNNGDWITIFVPIDGVGIDWETAVQWKMDAEAAWNTAFESDENPFKKCFKLYLWVEVEPRDWSYRATAGRHLVFSSHGASSSTALGTIARNLNRSPWHLSSDGNFDETLKDMARADRGIAHEIGHLMGLGDEYTTSYVMKNGVRTRVTTPIPGRENTLMADLGRIDAKLITQVVDQIRNASHNVPPCPKEEPSAAAPPAGGRDSCSERKIVRGLDFSWFCP